MSQKCMFERIAGCVNTVMFLYVGPKKQLYAWMCVERERERG